MPEAQNLTNVPMTWQRNPSESGYFGEKKSGPLGWGCERSLAPAPP